MAYHIKWTRRALKQLRSIDPRQGYIIASWVNENLEGCENPMEVGDCKNLKGIKNGWRWRLGNHRILGRAYGNTLTIDIFRVSDRRDAYRNSPKK